MRYLTVFIMCLAFAGCGERANAQSDAAATIWEAADAIEKGLPPNLATPAIKANAAAIIKSNGATYAPAGVK